MKKVGLRCGLKKSAVSSTRPEYHLTSFNIEVAKVGQFDNLTLKFKNFHIVIRFTSLQGSVDTKSKAGKCF